MKRFILVGVLLLFLSLGVSGCSGQDYKNSQKVTSAAPSAVDTTETAAQLSADAEIEKSRQEQLDLLRPSVAPANQPSTHKGRWEQGAYSSASCYECHNPVSPEKGAPIIPESHLIKDDKGNLSLSPAREICVSCHPLNIADSR